MPEVQKPHSSFDLATAQQRDRSQMSRGDMSLAMDAAYGEIERLVEQLEATREALTACGDVLFGTWDDDEARRAESRRAEGLTRAVLFDSNPASRQED